MKRGRISAIAAAGAIAVGSLAGVAGAGPASAASYTHLCVDGPSGVGSQCIDSELGTNQWVITLPSGTSSLTNWTYPTGDSWARIQQADNVNYCLQLDAAANNEVLGQKCNNNEPEEWINLYDATAKRTLFESVWALENYGTADCLAYSASKGGLWLEPCQTAGTKSLYWDQQWGTS
ncbi:MAG TPA: hypothetical protein VN847_02895 [Streptosporangiaceae bacterium]|nr:hypothetical protein [Streptosporangiaceae bacterium]